MQALATNQRVSLDDEMLPLDEIHFELPEQTRLTGTVLSESKLGVDCICSDDAGDHGAQMKRGTEMQVLLREKPIRATICNCFCYLGGLVFLSLEWLAKPI